jgi:DNA-binding transcriptional regulator LsrR (DeoR family)
VPGGESIDRSTPGVRPIPPADIDEFVDIATRFYLNGESQAQIAHSLGRDPSTISRYISQIRDMGIVRFEIRRPREHASEIAIALTERFGIRRAVVAADFDDVPRVAADYIGSQLESGIRVGISFGRMLEKTVQNLVAGTVSHLEVSVLHGGISYTGSSRDNLGLTRAMASLYPESRVIYLHAPVLVDSADIRRALLSDRSISAAIAAARSCELALVGIGAVNPDAPLVRYRHISEVDIKRLTDGGAVGDICTRFFTAGGKPLTVLDDRLIAVEWEELRAIPKVIAVAAGDVKTIAILGALRSGVVDVLITDAATAEAVMKADERRP